VPSEAAVRCETSIINRREDEGSVYAALYSFVVKNGERTQTLPVIPKDAFLLNTRQHPNCVDGERLGELDDEKYLDAIYWSLLNRVPEEDARRVWMKAAERTPGDRYRKKLSRRLSASLEAHTKGVLFLRRAPLDILTHIDISNAVRNSMPPGAFVLFYIKDRVIEPFIGTLYLAYSRTLRPYRIRLRDRLARSRGKGGPVV